MCENVHSAFCKIPENRSSIVYNKKLLVILEKNCVDNDGKSTICGYKLI